MKPHFSLNRLFVSTTLIAAGLAMLVRALNIPGLVHWLVDFPVCFAAGMMIGAGALVPFRLTSLGVLVGFIGSALYLTALALGL